MVANQIWRSSRRPEAQQPGLSRRIWWQVWAACQLCNWWAISLERWNKRLPRLLTPSAMHASLNLHPRLREIQAYGRGDWEPVTHQHSVCVRGCVFFFFSFAQKRCLPKTNGLPGKNRCFAPKRKGSRIVIQSINQSLLFRGPLQLVFVGG